MTGRRRPKARALRWTRRALADLEEIRAYIARDDADAADRWIAKLTTRGAITIRSPFAGRVVPELGRPDVRELLERSYRIVYRVQDDAVDILTVFEGHRLFPGEVSGHGP